MVTTDGLMVTTDHIHKTDPIMTKGSALIMLTTMMMALGIMRRMILLTHPLALKGMAHNRPHIIHHSSLPQKKKTQVIPNRPFLQQEALNLLLRRRRRQAIPRPVPEESRTTLRLPTRIRPWPACPRQQPAPQQNPLPLGCLLPSTTTLARLQTAAVVLRTKKRRSSSTLTSLAGRNL